MSQAPAGTLDAELCEVLDRVLHKGVVLRGEVVISVAEIELLYLDARLFLSSIDTAIRAGAWDPGKRRLSGRKVSGGEP